MSKPHHRKLKKQPGPVLEKIKKPSKDCTIQNEALYFNFRYLTSNKKHNFEALKNNADLQAKAYKKLTDQFVSWSQSSWKELSNKGKRNGGFEMMCVSDMKGSITDKVQEKIAADTKLHVFRFGDYRLVGLKGRRCAAVLHIVGFDWDFSLYDHG